MVFKYCFAGERGAVGDDVREGSEGVGCFGCGEAGGGGVGGGTCGEVGGGSEGGGGAGAVVGVMREVEGVGAGVGGVGGGGGVGAGAGVGCWGGWFGEGFEGIFVHVNVPDSDCVVGRASGEEFDIGGEEEPGKVGFVGVEDTARLESGGVVVLVHSPDVDVALGGSVRRHLERRVVWSTLLLPAARREPSLAILTLEMGTSSSGMS